MLPKERQAHPPMLVSFIVLNEKDTEKEQGKGEEWGKSEGKGWEGHTVVLVFFFFFGGESNKYLGLPPKKRLF